MSLTQLNGPLVVGPPNSPTSPANNTAIPQSPDLGPSAFFDGTMLIDPRFGYRAGGGTENNALLSVSVGVSNEVLVMDQVPSTKAVNNIAVAAAVATGVAMTLVSASGAGITVTTSATFIPQTGSTIAKGALAIDGVPALVSFGTNQSMAVADPTKNISRALSVTASSGGVGGAFIVTGTDLYGVAMTEKITAAAGISGGTTTNGKKAFKFISNVKPQFSDTVSYSIGTADIVGFPLCVNTFTYCTVGYLGALIVSSTGFVAAVSSTATNTTGDARGTYALQTAADGVRSLQMAIRLSPVALQTMAGYFGVTQA